MIEEIYIIRLRDFYLERKSKNFIGLTNEKSGLELRQDLKHLLIKFEN